MGGHSRQNNLPVFHPSVTVRVSGACPPDPNATEGVHLEPAVTYQEVLNIKKPHLGVIPRRLLTPIDVSSGGTYSRMLAKWKSNHSLCCGKLANGDLT